MKKIFLFLISILFILISISNIKIFAKTNYQYNVLFDYSTTYIVNTQSKIISSANNIKEVKTVDSYGIPTTLNIILKGNKDLEKSDIHNNSFIKCNEIEIIINSNYEIYELYLYDSFNNEIITSGTNSIYIDYLVDDRYSFKAILRGPGNLIDNRTYEMYQTECLFSFTVDTTPPTISGASIYMNGKYINSEINVKGIDESSGIKALYMLEAGGASYQNIGTSITISSSKNGLLSFYAMDNAGNISSLYYVYNDIEMPIGLIKNINGETLNNSYTEEDFYYQGSDYYSGISYMEYKIPSSSNFEIYEGQIISKSSEGGIYEFRCIDKAGNVSEISKINLYKVNSVVQLIRVPNSNKVYLTWDEDNYIVTINDNNYNKNEILSIEGTYDVKIENEIGNISYLSFEISCYYEFTKIVDANCLEDGYTLYTCISCNKEQKTNIKTNGTHIYEIKNLPPTCINSGGILHYCIICNEQYLTNIIPKLNHNFNTFITISPSCIETGERTYHCEVCGYIKRESINMLSHEFIVLDEKKENNEITRYNSCINCQTIIVEKISLESNTIINTINKILDSYSKYIIMILSITSCIWSLLIGIKIVIISKKEESINVRKMIKNYIIGLITIFIILLAIPYLIKGIVNCFFSLKML